MAIWQYDFIIIPRDELVVALGALPTKLTVDQFQALSFWTSRQPTQEDIDNFTKWRAELKSWSQDLRLWGTEESNRVDVFYKSGRISCIEFRIELRSLNIRFLKLLADFARCTNCVLVSAHSLAVVEPLRESILTYLCKSPGTNSVWSLLSDEPNSQLTRPLPKVFLSHTSSDKPFVSRLAVDLRSKNVPVWFDQWELKVGDSLSAKIADGIEGSGWLVVVLSKNSVQSAWVQKELNAALARELRERNVFVLPLVIDDCEIPLFLLDKVYANFKVSYEQGLESILSRVLEGE